MLKSRMPNRKPSADAYKQFQEYMSEGKTELQALQFMETRGCTYCNKQLEDDDGNINDLCNQLPCDSCLFCPASSLSWWGNETYIALEKDGSFNIDHGAADETLREEVPWHVMVSSMKSNQKIVPSTGGSKRKYYSMVTTGNISRKFTHEFKAVRMEVDKM